MLDDTTRDRIQTEVDGNDVLLFMKGTPIFPQCGFSAAVIQVLSHLQVKFSSVNVLEDPDIRDGIKQYSDWPTIPQLYVKGEFVGGCDIIREMYETGELKTFLEDKGLQSESAA
jgi:monothiol glutaredoxin